MRFGGIYAIVHRATNRVYVGSAHNIHNRIRGHRWKLNSNQSGCRHLQAAWNKYGADAFEVKVLERVDDPARLLEVEQRWLDKLKPHEFGFNVSASAESPMTGRKHRRSTRLKMAEAKRGKGWSPLQREARDVADVLRRKLPREVARQIQELARSGLKPLQIVGKLDGVTHSQIRAALADCGPYRTAADKSAKGMYP